MMTNSHWPYVMRNVTRLPVLNGIVPFFLVPQNMPRYVQMSRYSEWHVNLISRNKFIRDCRNTLFLKNVGKELNCLFKCQLNYILKKNESTFLKQRKPGGLQCPVLS